MSQSPLRIAANYPTQKRDSSRLTNTQAEFELLVIGVERFFVPFQVRQRIALTIPGFRILRLI